ncbi:MAG: class IV adenylate cyclase [Spirochaetaceae bacterium]|jgi:predicted adenylyl cyclase CyaB|nr:class IV adenylate cyclase [Spirochaetaceae bacterium]
MSIEVELKAWVENTKELKQKLLAVSSYQFTVIKEDCYFTEDISAAKPKKGLPFSGVRIRQEHLTADDQKTEENSFVVTYKTKELSGGIEVNNEKEFALCAVKNEDAMSACDNFKELLFRLGLKQGICKKKYCETYRSGDINAELVHIDQLGTFLEIEILLETDDQSSIEAAKKRLMDFLKLCNIGTDKIESRYYTEMLSAIQKEKATV